MKTTNLLTTLLRGTALASLAILPLATPAHAAGTKGKAAPTQIQKLEEEVEMLKSQLNELKAQMSQTVQTVNEADEAAKAAQVKALTAQGRANTAANDAKGFGDLAKKVDWASKTKVGGKMFFNFSNIYQQSDGVKGSKNGTNLEVKRFYVSVDHKFDDIYSANVTTDFNGYDSATNNGGEVYIKKAYIQAKYDEAFQVRVGAADLPWVPFVEDLYGYRYVENVLVDRTKFGTSTDWGIHASGKFADGLVGYGVAMVNGGGYRKANVRSKNVDFEGRIDVHPMKELTLAVGGYTGKLGNGVQGTTTYHTAQRFNALVAYTHKMFRIGGEYFYAKNWSNVTKVAEDSSNGWGVFASVIPMQDVSLFARYDWVKPKKDSAATLKDHYFNVGASYSPTKNVDIALVYKRDKAENGTISTSNGTIGGVIDGTYDEVGVWGQLKF